jgi:hypothetical protein
VTFQPASTGSLATFLVIIVAVVAAKVAAVYVSRLREADRRTSLGWSLPAASRIR